MQVCPGPAAAIRNRCLCASLLSQERSCCWSAEKRVRPGQGVPSLGQAPGELCLGAAGAQLLAGQQQGSESIAAQLREDVVLQQLCWQAEQACTTAVKGCTGLSSSALKLELASPAAGGPMPAALASITGCLQASTAANSCGSLCSNSMGNSLAIASTVSPLHGVNVGGSLCACVRACVCVCVCARSSEKLRQPKLQSARRRQASAPPSHCTIRFCASLAGPEATPCVGLGPAARCPAPNGAAYIKAAQRYIACSHTQAPVQDVETRASRAQLLDSWGQAVSRCRAERSWQAGGRRAG